MCMGRNGSYKNSLRNYSQFSDAPFKGNQRAHSENPTFTQIFNLEKKKFKNIPRVACSFIAVMRTFSSLHQLVCRWTAFPWEAPSLSSFLPQDLVLSPTVFSGRLRPLTSRLMSSTQAARLWQTLWMYNKHKVLHILRRHLDFCPWLRRWVLTSGLHSRSCWLIILRNKLPSGLGNFIIRLEIHWFGEFPQFLLASKSPASKGGEAHWR